VSLQVLESAGSANLKGKLLIDLANPLDFSKGMPPTLSVCNDTSLGEQIQANFPDARVVKSLNTVNCDVMVDASLVPGEHIMFLCGNDADAKAQVEGILKDCFGWKSVMDLGDISAARGMEMYLPLWLRLWGAVGSAKFNIQITRG
jgi:predicted dinucleotide-binding enzyme